MESLTDVEVQVLSTVLAHAENRSHEDRQSAVFSSRQDGRLLIDRARAVNLISQVLRHVTGDPKFRQHQLRRSFLCRSFTHVLKRVLDDSAGFPLSDGIVFDIDDSSEVSKKLYGYNEIIGESLRPLTVAIGHSMVGTTISHYMHIAEFYLAQLVGCAELPEGDNYAACYITGRTYDAVRRQRNRLVDEPKNLHALLTSYTPENDIFSDLPAETTAVSSENFEYSENTNDKIGLDDVERILLLRSVRHSAPVDSIAAAFMVTEKTVATLLDAAKKIESKEGYQYYHLSEGIRAGWHTGQQHISRGPDKMLQADTKRTRAVLKKLVKKIKDKKKSNQICDGLAEWMRAYSPALSMPVFESAMPCGRYFELIEALGFSRNHFVAYLPEAITSESANPIIEQLSELGIVAEQIRFRRITAKKITDDETDDQIVGPVGIALRSGASDVGHQKTLDRALFILCCA